MPKSEPQDRRRRWDQRMLDAGYKRVGLWVPAERVELFKELKRQLLDDSDYQALSDFVLCSYWSMLEDPDCDDLDRAFARQRLRELGASPAASGASEDALPSSLNSND